MEALLLLGKVEGSIFPQNLIKDARWRHPSTSGGLSFDAVALGGRWMECLQ